MALAAALLCAPPCAAAAKPPQAPPGFFGVNEGLASDEDLRRMPAADVGVYRTVLPYGLARSEPHGEWHWDGFDRIVRLSAIGGLQLVPNLYGVPPWVSEARNAVPLHDHEAVRGWRRFVEEAVGRYGNGGEFWAENPDLPYRPVTIWQIWNEPNSRTWWGPRPRPREYGVLLRRSAKAVSSVDPAARVMTAGIVAAPTNAHAIPGPDFMRALFRSSSVRRHTDAIGFHPYGSTVAAVQRQILDARRALRRSGFGKIPIWVTEIGWGSVGPSHHPLIKSERGQSRALRRTFEMAIRQRRRLGIARVLWYRWRDSPDDLCLWCESSGLLAEDASQKPLYETFRAVASR